ncbi:MAG: flagellin [Methanomicrobiales archaeon HGW-Methanomicrobiales-3]|nr:MAG: flagellin [Methanomicrobiales archaeon HGW-Methanomicrobiales-3]
MKNIYSEDAFTGLEAAIVLIAFVVVAAVFSYVVLGAGFFTTQTAQATVHTGVAQASSSLEVVGNVMGISNEGDQLSYANISVALTAGGTAMDLDQMVVSYTDNNGGRNPNVNATPGLGCAALTLGLDEDVAAAADTQWCVAQKINDRNPASPNNLLELNEIWVIAIQTPDSATVNTKITFNMQPSVGAVLPITRTLPGGLNKVQGIY